MPTADELRAELAALAREQLDVVGTDTVLEVARPAVRLMLKGEASAQSRAWPASTLDRSICARRVRCQGASPKLTASSWARFT